LQLARTANGLTADYLVISDCTCTSQTDRLDKIISSLKIYEQFNNFCEHLTKSNDNRRLSDIFATHIVAMQTQC